MPNVENLPTADPGSENEVDNNAPCQEDEEFSKSRQDAETVDEAINKFMGGNVAWRIRNAMASRPCNYFSNACLCSLPRQVKP